MVTKHSRPESLTSASLILAKIHMVTKLPVMCGLFGDGLILAKIHMVTKRTFCNEL